jgi:hypothetical protein
MRVHSTEYTAYGFGCGNGRGLARNIEAATTGHTTCGTSRPPPPSYVGDTRRYADGSHMPLQNWGFSPLDIASLSPAELAAFNDAITEHAAALSTLGIRHLRVARPTVPVSADYIRSEAAMLRRFAAQEKFALLSEPLFGTSSKSATVA